MNEFCFDIELVAKLLAPIITTIVVAAFKYYSEGKACVIAFMGHITSFPIKGTPPSSLYSHSIIVINTGRKTAKNIKLGHHFLPEHLTIFPSVQYSIEKNPEGISEIIIPTLVPKEQLTISYLYSPPITANQIHSYIKSDEGYAKIITAIPTEQPSVLTKVIAFVFMFIGASFTAYWLVKLVAYLI